MGRGISEVAHNMFKTFGNDEVEWIIVHLISERPEYFSSVLGKFIESNDLLVEFSPFSQSAVKLIYS